MKTNILLFNMLLASLVAMPLSATAGWHYREWDVDENQPMPHLPLPDDFRSVSSPVSVARGQAEAPRAVAFTPAGLPGRLPPGDDSRIRELARGLDHDWKRCFEFVRNNIAYVPYPGIVKGPERTLLDREGNAADQSFLLCALLRASGYDSATVLYTPLVWDSSFVSGFKLPKYNMDGKTTYTAISWLGVRSDGDIEAFFRSSGLPVCSLGDYHIGIEHYWVRVEIDGETSHLDPTIAPGTTILNQLPTWSSGYKRDDFLSAAGGSVDENSVRGLSAQGVEEYMTSLIANLKKAWDAPGASPETVLGGRKIVPYAPGDSRFHGEWSGRTAPIDLLASPNSTLNALRPRIHLDSSGFSFEKLGSDDAENLEFFLDEVGTRTLWFGKDAEGDLGFYVDDEEIAHSGVWKHFGGTSIGVEVIFTNASSYYSYAMLPEDGHVHVLGVDFGAAARDGIRKTATRTIERLRADSVPDSAPRMVAANLQLQAHQWFSQSAQFMHVWNRIVGASLGDYYNIGMASQTTGPSVDMGNEMGRGRGGRGLVHSHNMFGSALEHSVLEQLNGAGKQAVSTTKLLALANESGNPVYFVNASNAVAVTEALSGYSTGMLARVRSGASAGNVYLLPKNADIALNDWRGVGYITHEVSGDGFSHTGMMISGGMHGGNLTEEGEPDSGIYLEQSYRLGDYYQNAADGVSNQGDPIAMPAGAYVDSETDLTVLRALPLAWMRIYDSRGAEIFGDLGRGWSHVFEASVGVTSDADAVLGASSMEAVLPTVVAVVAAEDLMGLTGDVKELSAGEVARYWVAAALVANWWAQQLPQTCVTVKLGSQTLAFQKMPDGTYAAASGVTATLDRDDNGLFTLRERHGNTYAFNAGGKLETITDPNGNVTTLSYADGKLSRVDNPFGASLVIARDGGGRIATVTDNTGKSVDYAYDAEGCLVGVTDVAGNVWSYEYDANSHMMTGKRNPDDELLLSNLYNDFGQVVTQRLANGKTWRLGYAASAEAWNEDPKGGRLTERFDANARVVARTRRDGATETTAYDGHGNPTLTVDAAGTKTTFAYDARNNLLAATNGVGGEARSTLFGYDAEDRLVATTNALGEVSRFEYDNCHRVVKSTAADGRYVENVWNADGTLSESGYHAPDGALLLRTVYVHGSHGLPVSVTIHGEGLPEDGITTTAEYTADGNVAAKTDALGNRSVFGYDAAGRLVSVTDALGNTTTIGYDREGRIVAATDALGRETHTDYNASGLPVSTTYPDGTTTRIVYDEVEDVLETTDERGARTTFARDSEGRPVAVMDALGNVAEKCYDLLGRPWWSKDASGVESWVVYDAFSRPVETRNALGAVWSVEFDKLDRPVGTTSPLGQTTHSEYDEAGQVVRSVRASGALESFGYDASGNQVAYTNSEGHVYRMAYDALGRMVAATNALGRQVSKLDYDANGNLVRAVDGKGSVQTFAYDALNRLVVRTTPDDDVFLAYDAVGNVVSAANGTASESFEYDARDLLIAATISVGEMSVRNEWQRDAGGLVTNLVYAPGKAVAREYDIEGRLVAVRDWLGHEWTFAWDAAGRLASLVSPDGRTRTQTYDEAGRLVAWNVGDLVGRSLEYDLAGRKTCDNVTFGAMPAPVEENHSENVFDAADRLIASTVELDQGASHNEAFSYDDNDAMIRAEADGASLSFRYNADGTLAGMTTSGSSETTFAYDAFGNRVLARGHVWIPDQTDDLKRPLIECDETGNLVRAYIWAGGMLLGYVDANASLVIAHADEQGSVVALSQSNGTVLSTASYGPHGEDWGRSGKGSTPFAWLGGFGVQKIDGVAPFGDLYLTRYRLYSPGHQRFLSADPIGLAGGLNLHAYGNGNPVAYVDPIGLHFHESSESSQLLLKMDENEWSAGTGYTVDNFPADMIFRRGDFITFESGNRYVFTQDTSASTIFRTRELENSLDPDDLWDFKQGLGYRTALNNDLSNPWQSILTGIKLKIHAENQKYDGPLTYHYSPDNPFWKLYQKPALDQSAPNDVPKIYEMRNVVGNQQELPSTHVYDLAVWIDATFGVMNGELLSYYGSPFLWPWLGLFRNPKCNR